MKFKFNVGTFNLRSLKSEIRKEQLTNDLESYNIDVLCLQETKIQNGADNNVNGHRLICFDSTSPHYGCGFLINKTCRDSVLKVWNVSDRICVLVIKVKDNNTHGKSYTASIINVYAPTTQRAKQYPDEINQFYKDLGNTIKTIGNKSILILAGDFNAKVGKRLENDKCLGAYSKGKRNDNGHHLVEFCEEHKLFVTNSAFDHPSRHQTTWVGQRQNTDGNIINIYNQIDYIICRHRHKSFITNARSYGGTLLTSDHKLVKTSLNIDIYKQQHSENKAKTQGKINTSRIVNNRVCRTHYQYLLNTRLWDTQQEDNSIQNKWERTQEAMRVAAEQSAGFVNKNKTNRTHCPVIDELSQKQKELRIRIQNSKDLETITKLKKERNKILHSIRKETINKRNKELDQKVENIDKSKNASAMFQATKLLNQKPYENPKVKDNSGKAVTNPNDILEIISNHFREKFHDPHAQPIPQFTNIAKPLDNPITPTEVRNSFNRLNNNRAPGEDNIPAELFKYGTCILDITIANILNEVFASHQPLDINSGVLITLQKPGKLKGPPQNLRPITLLNTIRKALSTIVLDRIRPTVEQYLSHSQSGFRQERSTSDVVWTHKWLAAKVRKENIEISVTGIDMSAAFDTIDRSKLLEILSGILQEDEIRMVRFLISNTTVNAKINGATIQKPFESNIGTPQGDCLSPILFVIYLEHALREIRTNLPPSETTLESIIPREISYADDVDFIGDKPADIHTIQETLSKYNLKVNVEKTEQTKLSRNTNDWKTTKKVGSLIGDQEDVERRKQLSNAALYKLTNVWIRGDKIKQETKLKLYRSLVKPILLYNCGTWALTKADEDKLDAFHRKQLKKVLNIHYPTLITNESLYKQTEERPLSLDILEQRWRLFGHILRRNPSIPANMAMTAYYKKCGDSYRGRPITTLPIVLDKDLKLLVDNKSLKNEKDLELMRNTASDRSSWRELKHDIVQAAKASQSIDRDAKGP